MFEFFKKCECKNENLYRMVVEATRSSLDINQTKRTIINVIGQTLNADRCFIMEYDKNKDRFKEPQEEYLSSFELKSFERVDLNIKIPHFTEEFKKGKTLTYNQSRTRIGGRDVDLNDGTFEAEKSVIEEYKVYSAVAFPIFYVEEFLGELVVHYVDRHHNVGEDELNLLKTVSGQLAVALYQANLYEKIRLQSKTQNAVLNNIPFMVWLKDINGKFVLTNKKMSESFGFSPKELIGKEDADILPADLAAKYRKDDLEVMETKNTKITEEPIVYKYGEIWSETFKSPVFGKNGTVIGTAGVAHDITDRKEAEIELLKKQDKILKHAQRETLLRNLIEKIRSSLDIDKVLEYVCEETAKFFNVQRVSITQFLHLNTKERIKFRKEYKQDEWVLGRSDMENYNIISIWAYHLFADRSIYASDNIQLEDVPEFVKDSFTKVGIKSMLAKKISNQEKPWGLITLSEYEGYRQWSEEDKELLEIISNQLYIAITQSEAYMKQKQMAEREKISRNIIEILRSSMDKSIIKNLFVKNIGKFFNADRVCLAEYDSKEEKYLPVEPGAEYLLNKNEKSFVGYDWSDPDIAEYMIPLLEKREFNIPDWQKYLQDHPATSEGFRMLFDETDIKSSYNFPVLNQSDIMGYFCIDFTQKVCELSDEDISRIRSICTQAGIALYQANLYQTAQNAINSQKEFISQTGLVSQKILDNIVELSGEMSKQEDQCKEHIKYLNYVDKNIKLLLDLTNKLITNSDYKDF